MRPGPPAPASVSSPRPLLLAPACSPRALPCPQPACPAPAAVAVAGEQRRAAGNRPRSAPSPLRRAPCAQRLRWSPTRLLRGEQRPPRAPLSRAPVFARSPPAHSAGCLPLPREKEPRVPAGLLQPADPAAALPPSLTASPLAGAVAFLGQGWPPHLSCSFPLSFFRASAPLSLPPFLPNSALTLPVHRHPISPASGPPTPSVVFPSIVLLQGVGLHHFSLCGCTSPKVAYSSRRFSDVTRGSLCLAVYPESR